MNKVELISKLKLRGILKSYDIEQALLEVDRTDFVLPEDKGHSYTDSAFSIGYGQTISQPLTVVFMLELLGVKKGDKIMDIGTGSGWQAALLAFLTGENGKVETIEIVSKLLEYAKENVGKYPALADHIFFHEGSAINGLPESGEFDRIIAAAEVRDLPVAWTDQLKIGGTLVFPKDGGIYKITRNTVNDLDTLFFPGFVFVPFVEN